MSIKRPYLKCAVFCPELVDPEKTTLDDHIAELCTLIDQNLLNT
jgi:hypothetical protein